MKNFISHLKIEIEKDIRKIETGDEEIVKKSLAASQVLGDAFIRLKEFMSTYDFINEDEEIHFFKDIKPQLCKHLIYWRKIYNMEMNRPLTDYHEQILYFKNELDCIQKYAQKRLDFYRYYRKGATYLDKVYFTRNATDLDQYLESFFYETDPDFSTLADFKVARILANDMLQVHIMQELETLENHCKIISSITNPLIKLTWSGSKSDLVELIFALDTLKIFGKITLTQLSQYLQNVFNIDLGMNISRTFHEMKTRNDRTSFLDSLKEALLKRMDIRYKSGRKANDDKNRNIS